MAKRGRRSGVRQPAVYPSEGMKRCTLCGAVKPVGEFYERQTQHTEGARPVHAPACIPCNKRVVARAYWKGLLALEGEAPLLKHLETLRFQTGEAEEILRRHRAGLSVTHWVAGTEGDKE